VIKIYPHLARYCAHLILRLSPGLSQTLLTPLHLLERKTLILSLISCSLIQRPVPPLTTRMSRITRVLLILTSIALVNAASSQNQDTEHTQIVHETAKDTIQIADHDVSGPASEPRTLLKSIAKTISAPWTSRNKKERKKLSKTQIPSSSTKHDLIVSTQDKCQSANTEEEESDEELKVLPILDSHIAKLRSL